jgi:ribosomal protein L5
MLVGCKVTLRKNIMEDFFETLLLVLPRMNLFKGISEKELIKKKNVNFFSIVLKELFFFFTFESILGTTSNVQQININIMFSTKILEEKLFMFFSKKIPINK